MRKFFTHSLLALAVLGCFLLGLWTAREKVYMKRSQRVMHLLCEELQGYCLLNGQLPSSLEQLAATKPAGWLENTTKGVAVTFDPGSQVEQRMARVTVSAGHNSIALQGAPKDLVWPLQGNP